MQREIVVLDDDPFVSIESMYDTDVIGIPITICQVLLTVWDRVKPGVFPATLNLREGDCPWTDWAVSSKENYEDLWNYGMDIIDEHTFRFGSRALTPYRHGSLRRLESLQAVPDLPSLGLTPYPSKGREGYKQAGHFFTHTHREVPEWLK